MILVAVKMNWESQFIFNYFVDSRFYSSSDSLPVKSER